MSGELGPWLPWDFRGEDLGAREIHGRTVYFSRLPEGLYLARFLDLEGAGVRRFFGETRELAEQHAADYMSAFLTNPERALLELERARNYAEGVLLRTIGRLREERRELGLPDL